jgi:hypothetical protein
MGVSAADLQEQNNAADGANPSSVPLLGVCVCGWVGGWVGVGMGVGVGRWVWACVLFGIHTHTHTHTTKHAHTHTTQQKF